MRRASLSFVPALALVVGLAVAACGTTTTQATTSQSGGSSAAPTTTGASASAIIHTKTATVNNKSEVVLADASGKTLYYFKLDTPTTATCTGSCAQNWPPLAAPSNSLSGSVAGLTGTLSVLQGANGLQVAYNGHPLYRYFKDGDAGDVYGDGVGGKWFVATPDVAALTASNSASGGYGG